MSRIASQRACRQLAGFVVEWWDGVIQGNTSCRLPDPPRFCAHMFRPYQQGSGGCPGHTDVRVRACRQLYFIFSFTSTRTVQNPKKVVRPRARVEMTEVLEVEAPAILWGQLRVPPRERNGGSVSRCHVTDSHWLKFHGGSPLSHRYGCLTLLIL